MAPFVLEAGVNKHPLSTRRKPLGLFGGGELPSRLPPLWLGLRVDRGEDPKSSYLAYPLRNQLSGVSSREEGWQMHPAGGLQTACCAWGMRLIQSSRRTQKRQAR